MDIRDFNEGTAYTQSQISRAAVSYLGRYLPATINIGQEATLDAASKACLLHFENSRRSVLERHTWGFALKEDVLSEFVPEEKDIPRLNNAHLIPADCVHIVVVGSRCASSCSKIVNEGHSIREGLIFPCCGKVIRYVYDNILYYQWTASAINALTLLLCRNIASSVTADPTMGLYSVIDRHYEEAITQAIALDSYQQPITVIHDKRTPKFNKRGGWLWRR